MCGIAGFSGSYDRSVLFKMNDLISHRGPDDHGVMVSANGRIGLAHRRLSIIDLSALGHQPMASSDGRVQIVFNGEIYNFRELRAALEEDGFTFKGHSDTEVILNLYVKHGVGILEYLNGIFAFAIFDERDGTLFIARDHLGVKPLYYAEQPKGIVFASEMKALLRSGLVASDLDPSGILAHMTYLWSPGSGTLVKGIKKLEPGHAIVVLDGRIAKHWQYYDISYAKPHVAEAPEDCIRGVANRVRTAVQRQMVADVPVGAFLSGGLDSSAVIAFAAEVASEQRIQCFTIEINDQDVSREGIVSDLPYAKRVAKHLGVDLHTVSVGVEMMDRLDQMIYHLDEPTADPAALNALFISELASQTGIKVLLSGAGGDDIFTGYRRHYALRQERFWSWLPVHIRRIVAGAATSLPVKNPSLRRISKALQYADLDQQERIASYFCWTSPAVALKLLSSEIRSQLPTEGMFGPLERTLSLPPVGTAPVDRMLYLECKHFLADHNLNYTDKMGMATGVEVRVPLLDIELVDYVAKLPVDLKQKGAVGKWIFKKAMEPYLPRDVIYRPKTGFGVPLRQWLKTRLRPLVDDLLSPHSILSRGLFDPKAVHELIERDRLGSIDGTYTVFSLLCMEMWCRQFIDGDYPLAVTRNGEFGEQTRRAQSAG